MLRSPEIPPENLREQAARSASRINHQTMPTEIAAAEPSCLDAVNETLGTLEVDGNSTPGAATIATTKRQISNLSLPKKKSGIAGACSNLVNSIVGAGIIGIPFALKESGFVAGVFLLFIVSYFTGEFTVA